MTKYDPLQHHLDGLHADVWRATFADVERVLGFRLPDSARSYPAWWANDQSHSCARVWLDVGWRTSEVDLGSECLIFRRDGRTSQQRARGAAIGVNPEQPEQSAGSLEFRLRMEWKVLGKVVLDDAGGLSFPKAASAPAIYRFQLRLPDTQAQYIGETENLARRFAHYRSPGPSQATNLRLNATFKAALEAGADITVTVAKSGAWIDRGTLRQDADFTSKVVRCLFENAAILDTGAAGIESLNRADRRVGPQTMTIKSSG